MATIDVKDAAGTTRTIQAPNSNGRAAAAGSRPVALATEDLAAINAISTALADVAVSGKQDTANASLASIASALADVAVAGKQDTGNASLASIAAAVGGTLTATLGASENRIGAVGSLGAIVSASFNRPADTTAYATGDLVANSVAAGSVVPLNLPLARINGGTGSIRRVRLSTSKTGLAGTETFRVHLFKTLPTPANGDNGAFSVNGVATGWLGRLDVVMNQVFNDGARGLGVPHVGAEMAFDAAPGSQSLYALIEARGAYTPTSGETFTLVVEAVRN